jgi:hypothetical protein
MPSVIEPAYAGSGFAAQADADTTKLKSKMTPSIIRMIDFDIIDLLVLCVIRLSLRVRDNLVTVYLLSPIGKQ